MPQLEAAKKALRASRHRRIVNDRWRLKLRRSLHAVKDAIAKNDSAAATKAVLTAESVLDRAARRNIIHPNKAARKKSRLRRAAAVITK